MIIEIINLHLEFQYPSLRFLSDVIPTQRLRVNGLCAPGNDEGTVRAEKQVIPCHRLPRSVQLAYNVFMYRYRYDCNVPRT